MDPQRGPAQVRSTVFISLYNLAMKATNRACKCLQVVAKASPNPRFAPFEYLGEYAYSSQMLFFILFTLIDFFGGNIVSKKCLMVCDKMKYVFIVLRLF